MIIEYGKKTIMSITAPAEYEFSSIHKVFVVGTHQVNIPKEVSKRVEVKYPLDFDKVLPTKVAEAQLEQVTVEAFATKWQNTLIRQSSITKGRLSIKKKEINMYCTDIRSFGVNFLVSGVKDG